MTSEEGCKPVQALVEIDVAGRHAGDGLAPVEQPFQAVERLHQQALQRLEAVGHPALGDVEDQGLGPVDRRGHVVGHAVAHLGDLAGDGDEPAQQGVLLHDPGVAGRVGRGRRVGLQRDQCGQAADRLEQAGTGQLVGDGDGIGRLAPAVQGGDGVEDVAVGRLVEVVGGAGLHRGGDGVAGQQHGARAGTARRPDCGAGSGRSRSAILRRASSIDCTMGVSPNSLAPVGNQTLLRQ